MVLLAKMKKKLVPLVTGVDIYGANFISNAVLFSLSLCRFHKHLLMKKWKLTSQTMPDANLDLKTSFICGSFFWNSWLMRTFVPL